MPRDGSGVYSLPAGNPVVTNTIIASAWANSTLGDIAAQLNNVFTRDGLLGPTAPFKIVDGTAAAPGLAWNSEPGMGWYRASAGNRGFVTGGLAVEHLSSTATSTFLSIYPRADAAASAQFTVFDKSTNATVYTQFYMLNDAAASVLGQAQFGGAAKKPLSHVGASLYTFDNSVTSTVGVQAPTLKLDDAAYWNQDATYTYFNYKPGWHWAYNKTTNELFWNHGGATATKLQANGDFVAGKDIYTGGGGGSLALINAGVFPYVRFTTDGWKLIYAAGDLNWQRPDGMNMSTHKSNGDMQCIGGFKTTGTIATQFLGNQSTQYIAIGDPGVGQTMQIAFLHEPGVWIGTRIISGSGGQYQFTSDGIPRATRAGPWDGLVSDGRVKENIEDFTDGLEAILALRPRRFTYIPEVGIEGPQLGYVEQEARAVLPTSKASIRVEGFDDLRNISIQPVEYMLVNAIKKLHARIAALEGVAA